MISYADVCSGKISPAEDKIDKRLKFRTKDELEDAIREFAYRREEDLPLEEYADPNSWDVSEVTDMSYLFFFKDFNEPIGDWDVSNVTDMSCMFSRSGFNQDISRWNVGGVKDMKNMFSNSSFDGDISEWDVSGVESLAMMFFGKETKFTGDVSKWKFHPNVNVRAIFNRSKYPGDISRWYFQDLDDEYTLKRIEVCRNKNAFKIQDWWAEILLNPHHPLGKKNLERKALEVCSY